MLEVLHNPDQLQAHKRVVVYNLRNAQNTLRKLLDAKRARGLRIRHSYDIATKSVYLEARSSLALSAALNALKGNIKYADCKRVPVQ